MVPIFRSQIERGGPVTVTDPEMTRYFMTIPEAVQLVIRSGDLGGASGEVFVLEMGEPVKIVDLAHNMIRLAGYEPEVDIAVEFIGARPGEKLHEELFNSDERPQPTASDRIVRAVRRAPLDPEWVQRHRSPGSSRWSARATRPTSPKQTVELVHAAPRRRRRSGRAGGFATTGPPSNIPRRRP